MSTDKIKQDDDNLVPGRRKFLNTAALAGLAGAGLSVGLSSCKQEAAPPAAAPTIAPATKPAVAPTAAPELTRVSDGRRAPLPGTAARSARVYGCLGRDISNVVRPRSITEPR